MVGSQWHVGVNAWSTSAWAQTWLVSYKLSRMIMVNIVGHNIGLISTLKTMWTIVSWVQTIYQPIIFITNSSLYGLQYIY